MSSMTEHRSIVIGGGIVGLSIAAELAMRGSAVSLVEAGRVAGGTTSTSYAWVNANGKEPYSYFQLNEAGMRAHEQLAEGAETGFVQTGHLEIASEETHAIDLCRRAERLADLGYRVDEITPEAALNLEPGLILPETPRAIILFPDEGYVYPALYTAEAVSRLRHMGVMVYESMPVASVGPESGLVTLRNGESLTADDVVIAAGRWSAELVQSAGGYAPLIQYATPGDLTVGYLLRTRPLTAKLSRVVTTSWLNFRPEGGGRLLLQGLDLDATANPDEQPAADGHVSHEMLARLERVLADGRGAAVEEVAVGVRVMPKDGRTLAGQVPGSPWLYVAATHSGVTLAPFLGEAVAEEILGGQEPLLDNFRPKRFVDGTTFGAPRRPRRPGEQ